ncbi:MAG: NUDIX hydrolase [Chloroflexota bacterium]|nr:NUDIX hydrolase [Chloroflexota bacterium]
MSNRDRDAYCLSLPKRRTGPGALLTDRAGRILVVEPRYKATWEIPGGIVEAGEDPRTTCRRECMEELGLDIVPGRLLAIEHKTEIHRKAVPSCSSTMAARWLMTRQSSCQQTSCAVSASLLQRRLGGS